MESVYVVVADGGGPYFANLVLLNETVNILNPTGFGYVNGQQSDLVISVYIANTQKPNNPGTLLQTVTIDVRCLNSSSSGSVGDVELGMAYGGFTLTSFDIVGASGKNEQVTVDATVEITYTIENNSVFGAVVDSGIISSFFSGPDQQYFKQLKRLAPHETVNVLTEDRTLNLIEASMKASYVFGFSVQGYADTRAGLPCSSFPILFFNVKPAA